MPEVDQVAIQGALLLLVFEKLSVYPHRTPNRYPSVPSCISTLVPIPCKASPLPPVPTFPPPVPGEVLDIDNASAEELRQALKIRNQQYEDLTRFIFKITELHVAEVRKFRR